jgi:hypothetical protein
MPGPPQTSNAGNTQPQTTVNAPPVNPPLDRITPRLKSWGMTSGGDGMPYTVMMRWPRTQGSFLGLPDVYSEEFATNIDQAANTQCTPLRNDPLVLGYFVGNEPAFDDRENELV